MAQINTNKAVAKNQQIVFLKQAKKTNAINITR
jgi:hypothetical protein